MVDLDRLRRLNDATAIVADAFALAYERKSLEITKSRRRVYAFIVPVHPPAFLHAYPRDVTSMYRNQGTIESLLPSVLSCCHTPTSVEPS